MITSSRLRGGPLSTALRSVRGRLPEVNFITLHYAYFILTSLITALIFWGASTPFKSVAFTDALFLCSSAMTEAGLNTINLSDLNTFQQVMLFLLIIAGSAIFVSAFIVFVRLKAFEKEFRNAIKQRRQQKNSKRAETNLSRIQSFYSRTSRSDTKWSQQQPSRAAIAEEPSYRSDEKLKIVTQPDHAQQSEQKSSSTYEAGTSATEDTTSGPRHSADIRHGDTAERQATTPTSSYVPFSPSEERNGRVFFRSGTAGPMEQAKSPELHRPIFSFTGVGASGDPRQRRRPTIRDPNVAAQRAATYQNNGHSTEPWFHSKLGYIARNSQFYGLSFDEREKLGGYEYSAILFLSFIVPVYFIAWQLLGSIALGAYVQNNRAGTAAVNDLNPFWVGAFNAVSAFNNSGMSLLDANMVAFQNSIFMLISMGLFILAGNTAYPIFLRLAIWTMYKILPADENWSHEKQTLKFLLDHPRRCYTNLFPRRHTWWLVFVLILLNSVDWAAFEILNIGNTNITHALNPGIEVIDGLFQSLAVRCGGFYVVPIPSIRISLQVLYVIMMYISAYPVVISMRSSNVYEEQSLGIFADEKPPEEKPAEPLPKMGQLKRRMTTLVNAPQRENASYFFRAQLHAQLAHDIWWIVAAVFLIMIIEGAQFERDPVHFSVFNVVFEVVSGYASVGISVGVPNNDYSFSGSFSVLSKLVMVAVMIRGRHRGLPVAIDHAVRLPGARMYQDEQNEDFLHSQHRQMSTHAGLSSAG